jgi:hypothetical protein
VNAWSWPVPVDPVVAAPAGGTVATAVTALSRTAVARAAGRAAGRGMSCSTSRGGVGHGATRRSTSFVGHVMRRSTSFSGRADSSVELIRRSSLSRPRRRALRRSGAARTPSPGRPAPWAGRGEPVTLVDLDAGESRQRASGQPCRRTTWVADPRSPCSRTRRVTGEETPAVAVDVTCVSMACTRGTLRGRPGRFGSMVGQRTPGELVRDPDACTWPVLGVPPYPTNIEGAVDPWT